MPIVRYVDAGTIRSSKPVKQEYLKAGGGSMRIEPIAEHEIDAIIRLASRRGGEDAMILGFYAILAKKINEIIRTLDPPNLIPY
jgi:hypothetical protein